MRDRHVALSRHFPLFQHIKSHTALSNSILHYYYFLHFSQGDFDWALFQVHGPWALGSIHTLENKNIQSKGGTNGPTSIALLFEKLLLSPISLRDTLSPSSSHFFFPYLPSSFPPPTFSSPCVPLYIILSTLPSCPSLHYPRCFFSWL